MPVKSECCWWPHVASFQAGIREELERAGVLYTTLSIPTLKEQSLALPSSLLLLQSPIRQHEVQLRNADVDIAHHPGVRGIWVGVLPRPLSRCVAVRKTFPL